MKNPEARKDTGNAGHSRGSTHLCEPPRTVRRPGRAEELERFAGPWVEDGRKEMKCH